MSLNFNLEAILRMAEQIERNGEAFYQRAAAMVDPGPVRDTLLRLAGMEATHESTFATMREAVAAEASTGDVYDVGGHIEVFASDLADRHVFSQGTPIELLTGCATPAAVLEAALRFEYASVEFFTTLLVLIPEALGRGGLELLIEEEREHAALLEEEKQRLETVGA